MSKDKKLESRGYKKYDAAISMPSVKYFYQKKFTDTNGRTKYFINAEKYEFSKREAGMDVDAFEYTAVFYSKGFHEPCAVRMYGGWDDIERVETCAEQMFRCGAFEYEDEDEQIKE